jgi:TPR repeat protein
MPLQDRFIFRFGFILTVIFISLIFVNPCRSFAGDATDIRKLAEQGDADAQASLGFMYGNGQGVPQDYKEAVRWFRKAAEQGNANAQCNLGVAYDSGQGVSTGL